MPHLIYVVSFARPGNAGLLILARDQHGEPRDLHNLVIS
jgi:hypothetical protein